MSIVLGKVLKSLRPDHLAYWCPGCKTIHVVKIDPDQKPCWTWNGNPDKPTFSPSILVKTGRAVDPKYEPHGNDPPEICHCFIRNGVIDFLTDCKHDLAGRKVEMVPCENWYDGEAED